MGDPVPWESGSKRVIRSGSWVGSAEADFVSSRRGEFLDHRGDHIGFRCVRIRV